MSARWGEWWRQKAHPLMDTAKSECGTPGERLPHVNTVSRLLTGEGGDFSNLGAL